MSEDNKSNQASQNPADAGTNASAGERLDQFITAAKRVSNVAGVKAKEFADAAAPRIKQIGDSATQHVSQAFDTTSGNGSFLSKIRRFYATGDAKRKRIIWIVAAAYGLLMIIVIPIFFDGSKSSGDKPGSTAVTKNDGKGDFWSKHSGTWNLTVHFRDKGDFHVGRHFKMTVSQSSVTDLRFWVDETNGEMEFPSSKVQITSTGADDATIVTGLGGNISLHLHFDGTTVSGYGQLDDGSQKQITGDVE